MRMRLFPDEPISAPSFFKSDGRFDVVAQNRFAGIDFAAEHGLDAFAQERFAERGVCLYTRLHGCFEISG